MFESAFAGCSRICEASTAITGEVLWIAQRSTPDFALCCWDRGKGVGIFATDPEV